MNLSYGLCLILVIVESVIAVSDIVVSVVSPGVFQVNAQVAGSKAESDTLLFDTGSPFTWLYHYKYVSDVLHFPRGGYGVTRLRTRIQPPIGGSNIKYVDESEFGASVWTMKQFTMGDHSWEQPFGIADLVKQSDPIPLMTGLLGASRDSSFSQTHPVFGFEPIGPGRLALHLDHQNGKDVCERGTFTYFNLSNGGMFARHWATDTVIKFGKVAFNTGVIVDSGSSVIVLNLPMFSKFREQLSFAGVSVDYGRSSMSGTVSCHYIDQMPSWEIHQGSQVVLITPRMYVTRKSGGMCRVAVAGIQGNHPMILGTPALRWIASEFDVKNNRMGLCAPKKSFVIGPGMIELDETQDCPSCDEKYSRLISYKSGFTLALVLLAVTA